MLDETAILDDVCTLALILFYKYGYSLDSADIYILNKVKQMQAYIHVLGGGSNISDSIYVNGKPQSLR